MWFDDTKKLLLSDYEHVKNRHFQHFSRQAGVINYGTFGSVKSPGLSDLDLCVLVEDEALVSGSFKLLPDLASEKYVLHHPPMVIPLSLMGELPFYHLIDINWEKEGGIPNVDKPKEIRQIVAINVLNKTVYLQSVLFSLLVSSVKPCRRGILALTSVARSVEWLERYSFKVNDAENQYVKRILSFRDEWIKSNNITSENYQRLDELLQEALAISISLPERLSRELLGYDNVPPVNNSDYWSRVESTNPMNFIIEADISDPMRLVSSVVERRILNKALNLMGRLKPILFGGVAFVGNCTFSILSLENSINRSVKSGHSLRDAFEKYDRHDCQTNKAARVVLEKMLMKRADVNKDFALVLKHSNLLCANFGCITYAGSLIERCIWLSSKLFSNVFSAKTMYKLV